MRKQIIVSLLPLVLACCSSERGNPLGPKPTVPAAVGPNGSAQAGSAVVADWVASRLEWRCITTSPREKWLGQAKSEPACPLQAVRASRLGETSLVGAAAATAPANLTFSVSDDSTVTLTWTSSGSELALGHIVEAGSASGLANLANFDTASAATSLTVANVPVGTYYVRVRTRAASGISGPSNEVVVTVGGTCAAPPGQPTGLSGSSSGSSVTLMWLAPAGGCPVTDFVIEAGTSSGLSNLANFSTGSTATTFTASGVANGTYYVRVRARNAAGTSAASNEATIAVGFVVLTDLDERTDWRACQDTPSGCHEGVAACMVDRVSAPVYAGPSSIRCRLTGGVAYANCHCYLNLPPSPEATRFELHLRFRYTPSSTFNNAGSPSVVQAIEATVSKWLQGRRWETAWQWENVGGAGAPQIKYWRPGQWVATGRSASLNSDQWYTLIIRGEIVDSQVHYTEFVLDGVTQPLDVTVPSAATPGELDRLAVAVQLDGNALGTPYDVYFDDVILKYR